MLRATDRRLLRLALRAELRNPGIRLLLAAGILGAAAFAWSQREVPGNAAVVLSTWLARIHGAAACLWFAYAAVRDQNERLGAVFRSKPVDGARWVYTQWAAGLLVWLLLFGTAMAAAAAAQLPGGPGRAISGCFLGFCRGALVVAAMGSASFSLSRMMRSPVGGLMVAFAWFCAMAGLQNIPLYLRPDFVQNAPLFLAAAALLLFLAGVVLERARRGEFRSGWVAPGGALLLTSALVGSGGSAYRSAPHVFTRDSLLWEGTARQDIQQGERMPGFWLPDGRGGTIRTAALQGQVILLFLFSPHDLEGARTLPFLDRLQADYGARAVRVVGICISPDRAEAAILRAGGGYRFPIVGDPSTVTVGPPPDSAVTAAYRAETLPLLVVADRARTVRLVDPAVVPDEGRVRRLLEELTVQ